MSDSRRADEEATHRARDPDDGDLLGHARWSRFRDDGGRSWLSLCDAVMLRVGSGLTWLLSSKARDRLWC